MTYTTPLFKALLMIGMLIGSSELLLRITSLENHLHYPSLNSRNAIFEIKVYELNQLRGKVDCIFFGNSMVYYGIDTEIIEREYQQQTGQSITCFNFGVPGLKASAASTVAELLIERYHPKLLIYGTAARDYGGVGGNELDSEIINNAWVKYQVGEFNGEGWLQEHLKVYGYYLRYRNWMSPDFTGQLKEFRHGYWLELQNSIDVRSAPNPTTEPEHFLQFSEYTPLSVHVDGLMEIIQLCKSSETQFIVLEMPVHPTFMLYFGDKENDYQEFYGAVTEITEQNHIPFWRTSRILPFQDTNWTDRQHLNSNGAQLLSEWTAEQLAKVTQ